MFRHLNLPCPYFCIHLFIRGGMQTPVADGVSLGVIDLSLDIRDAKQMTPCKCASEFPRVRHDPLFHHAASTI